MLLFESCPLLVPTLLLNGTGVFMDSSIPSFEIGSRLNFKLNLSTSAPTCGSRGLEIGWPLFSHLLREQQKSVLTCPSTFSENIFLFSHLVMPKKISAALPQFHCYFFWESVFSFSFSLTGDSWRWYLIIIQPEMQQQYHTMFHNLICILHKSHIITTYKLNFRFRKT